jgi:hypothetical protein
MKKFLLITPFILLAACDNQPATVNLDCVYWQIQARIYNDKAILDVTQNGRFDKEFLVEQAKIPQGWPTYKNKRIVLYRQAEKEYDYVNFGTRLTFVGHEPQTGQQILFQMWYKSQTLSLFTINLVGQSRYICDVLTPFKIEYTRV